MRRPRVLLDANVLVDAQVRDLFLRLAEADLIEVRWSKPIVEEVRRALTERLGLPPAKVDHLCDVLHRAFPHAAVAGFDSSLTASIFPTPTTATLSPLPFMASAICS